MTATKPEHSPAAMRVLRWRIPVFASLLCASRLAGAGPEHVVSLIVDGRDELRISTGQLTIYHMTYSVPTNLVINGVATPLVWHGLLFTDPVPVPFVGDFWINKSVGRDGGYAVQRSDGFMLVAVDDPIGSGEYEWQFCRAPITQSINWMHVRGSGGVPGAMSLAGTPGYVAMTPGSTLTFSLTIDGSDELRFVNGQLVIRHVNNGLPTGLTINGQSVALVWSGGISQAIPVPLPDSLLFTQMTGRGTLYPVETAVGFVISARDEEVGADTYTWTVVATCYVNCDKSTSTPMLTANDFQCYLNSFAEGSPYANCDGSTSTPALTANDFQCFLNRYASGCT